MGYPKHIPSRHKARPKSGELERIEDEARRHPMAGFGYYQTMSRNRVERKRQHEAQRAAIK